MRARSRWPCAATVSAVVAAGLCPALAALQGPYNIVAYSSDRWTAGTIAAMSSNGYVVGDTTHGQPYLATHPQTIVLLHDYGGTVNDVVEGVNKLGQAVGYTSLPKVNGQAVYHACLWDVPQKKFVDLGTLGGLRSIATGINDTGDVVGYGEVADGSTHAFLRPAGSRMTDLGTFGGQWGMAKAINNKGQIAGLMFDGEANRGIFYDHGDTRDIGDLGGGQCKPYCINDSGWIGGGSTGAPDQPAHAFIWTPSGGMTDLKCLGGDAAAWAINSKGQVVGCSWDAPEGEAFRHLRAFVAAKGSPLWVLEDLVPRCTGEQPGDLAYGMGITDSGQIAVVDHANFGPYRSYLMLPVQQLSDFFKAWQKRSASADLDGDGQVTTRDAEAAIAQYLQEHGAAAAASPR